MSVGVDPGGHQGMDVDHPAALADLEDQGVGGHERVGPGVQRAVPEVRDLAVEVLGHLAHLGLRQPGDAQGLDELLHPPGRGPEQVAGGDHGGQRPLRPAAALQQPVREVGPGPQLGDRHVQGAGAGVEVPMPVAVAHVGPLAGPGAVLRAADRVCLSRHEGVDERGQHLAQQVRTGLGQLLVQEVGRVDTARSGHRVVLLKDCERSSRRSRGGRLYVEGPLVAGAVAHHLGGRHFRPSAVRGPTGCPVPRTGVPPVPIQSPSSPQKVPPLPIQSPKRSAASLRNHACPTVNPQLSVASQNRPAIPKRQARVRDALVDRRSGS
jgi:hypothetical protein